MAYAAVIQIRKACAGGSFAVRFPDCFRHGCRGFRDPGSIARHIFSPGFWVGQSFASFGCFAGADARIRGRFHGGQCTCLPHSFAVCLRARVPRDWAARLRCRDEMARENRRGVLISNVRWLHAFYFIMPVSARLKLCFSHRAGRVPFSFGCYRPRVAECDR